MAHWWKLGPFRDRNGEESLGFRGLGLRVQDLRFRKAAQGLGLGDLGFRGAIWLEV